MINGGAITSQSAIRMRRLIIGEGVENAFGAMQLAPVTSGWA